MVKHLPDAQLPGASADDAPPSKRRRVERLSSASPDPLLLGGNGEAAAAAATAASASPNRYNAAIKPGPAGAEVPSTPRESVRAKPAPATAPSSSSRRKRTLVEMVVPARTSGRVGRPSRRALEGGETAQSCRSRSRGGASASAGSATGSPVLGGDPEKAPPVRAVKTDEEDDKDDDEDDEDDDESDDDDDDEDDYHALPSRLQFLTNESLRRSREARNYTWQGDVNEPRSLRGGKVVTTPTKGKGKEQAAKGINANGHGSPPPALNAGPGLMTPSKRLRNGTAGSPAQRNGNGMAPSPLRRSTLAGTVQDVVEKEDKDVNMDGSEGEEEMEVEEISPDQEAVDQAVLQELLEPDGAAPNGQDSLRPPAAQPPADETSTHRTRFLHTVIAGLTRPPPTFPSPPITLPVPEADNDGLQGVLNLLRGTVDRGEGNSCLVLGVKGCGKTRTINRAITLLRDGIADPASQPLVIRLDGLVQLNDALAIKEMGRQIAESEGAAMPDEGDAYEDALDAFPPTTLPAHLLAHLTAPSPRAVIIVMESFDLFIDHARQALLYCLLDVVQGVRTGPVEQTGRGVAVVGVTSKVNAHFKLEKRVKSRFSQRIIRVTSPLAGTVAQDGHWRDIVRPLLTGGEGEIDEGWRGSVESVLGAELVAYAVTRLISLTADVRILLRAFVEPIYTLLTDKTATLTEQLVVDSIKRQIISSEWGDNYQKLLALSHPALVILIIAKTFAFAGRDDINFAMVEAEYQRIHKTDMAGKGKHAWAPGVLQAAWKHLISMGVLIYASRNRPPSNPYMHQFIMCRCILSKTDILGFFKGETGGNQITGLGSEWMTLAKRAGGNV